MVPGLLDHVAHDLQVLVLLHPHVDHQSQLANHQDEQQDRVLPQRIHFELQDEWHDAGSVLYRHGHAVGFPNGSAAAEPGNQQDDGAQDDHRYGHLLGSQSFREVIHVTDFAEQQSSEYDQQYAAYLRKGNVEFINPEPTRVV